MRLVLLITEGPARGRRKGMRVPCKLLVGRSWDADLSVAEDPQLSEKHFRLDCQPSQCTLFDLHSTSGTLVNDQPVDGTRVVHNGDTITAGESSFRLVLEPATAEPPAGRAAATPPAQPPSAPSSTLHRSRRSTEATHLVCVQIVSGPDQGRQNWIRTGQSLRVGSSEQADLVIHGDPAVAGLHFSLDFDGRVCQVRDRGGGFGILLNGTPVSESAVYTGDRLQIGVTELRITLGPTRPRPAAATEPTVALASFALHDLIERWVPHDAQWPFAIGFSDPVEAVRREAMRTAAWSRQPWLMPYCAAATVHPQLADALDVAEMFAILAGGDQLVAMRRLLAREDLGSERYRLAGIYGHPQLLDELVAVLDAGPPACAIAASDALERITGADLPTVERMANAEGEPGAALVIEPRAARSYLRAAAQRLGVGERFSRGINISPGQPWQPQPLDLAARAAAVLREHYHGRRLATRREKQLRFPA